MNRRQLLVGGGAITTALLAGCTGNAQTGGGSNDTRTITVSNAGEVTAEPDLAILRVSVEATGADAETVRSELAERSDRLHDGLVDAGIPEDRITTDRFDIRERPDRREGESPEDERESGDGGSRRYEGTHAFRVEVTEIDTVGDVVDTAVEAGADSTGRIEYTLSEDKRAERREEALESALGAAREEATFVASEVDASVVDVRSVDTSDGRVSPVSREVAAEDDSGDTELRPDDVTVRATATVTYTIE
ncbi:MAG: SIMPL domain-containing protein [Halohasta sp.]